VVTILRQLGPPTAFTIVGSLRHFRRIRIGPTLGWWDHPHRHSPVAVVTGDALDVIPDVFRVQPQASERRQILHDRALDFGRRNLVATGPPTASR
jgi:hypothetical protein